jgi:hypothetical protein
MSVQISSPPLIEVLFENGEGSVHEDVAVDIPDDAAALEDAVDASDYNRGKRFKRLYATLSSAQVSQSASDSCTCFKHIIEFGAWHDSSEYKFIPALEHPPLHKCLSCDCLFRQLLSCFGHVNLAAFKDSVCSCLTFRSSTPLRSTGHARTSCQLPHALSRSGRSSPSCC